ncbi:MAG: ligase-associated DNA damage response exonuclease [Rhodospirillales bacterium]
MPPPPESWLKVTPAGLYCEPGRFHIDPVRGVDRAVITHGHADHARPGNRSVLATAGTIAIMRARYGAAAGDTLQETAYGARTEINGVGVTLYPAGHVLGSAQVLIEHAGSRVVVSGDYKRRRDPTCDAFEPVPCDVFVTEATFGLPVFRHPDDATEIRRLLEALGLFPERSLLLGAYALGKCQRLIMLLREAGHDAPIYLHGAQQALCDLYREQGVALGDLRPVAGTPKEDLMGRIVLAPPSALADRWSRRLPDPVRAMASGWMRVRQRARQRGVEMPLILSDHADWDELTATIRDVGAPRVWVTHGAEEALIHWATQQGFEAEALSLVGFEAESET